MARWLYRVVLIPSLRLPVLARFVVIVISGTLPEVSGKRAAEDGGSERVVLPARKEHEGYMLTT